MKCRVPTYAIQINDADGVRTRNLRIESPAIFQLIYDAKVRWDGVEPSRSKETTGLQPVGPANAQPPRDVKEGGGLEPQAFRLHLFSRQGPPHWRTSPSICNTPSGFRSRSCALRERRLTIRPTGQLNKIRSGRRWARSTSSKLLHPTSNRSSGQPAIHLPYKTGAGIEPTKCAVAVRRLCHSANRPNESR